MVAKVAADGTLVQDTGDWLSPSGINSLLSSLGLIVGKDGTITQTGTTAGQEVGTTTTTSPEALGVAGQILPSLISGIQSRDYSKQAAIADSQGIVNQVMQNYKEQVLPQIFAGEASRGGYASTSKALLSNDAASRAAAQAAALVADTVTKYGNIQGTQTNAIANLMNTLVNANKVSTTSLSKTGTEGVNRTTKDQGLGSNSLVQGLGGAAAVYSALAKLGIFKPEQMKTIYNSLFGPGAPVGSTGVDAAADIGQSIADLGGSSDVLSTSDLLALGAAGEGLPY